MAASISHDDVNAEPQCLMACSAESRNYDARVAWVEKYRSFITVVAPTIAVIGAVVGVIIWGVRLQDSVDRHEFVIAFALA